MNAGKSTGLLQYRYNLLQRGLKVFCGSPVQNFIKSRLDISCTAHHLLADDITQLINGDESAILIDEAQFLNKQQVKSLCMIADNNIEVRVYGLRTDFLGNLFEGSKYILAWADHLIDIHTSCFCARRATMTLRLDNNNVPIISGNQKQIEGNYISVCRKHYFQFINQKGKSVEIK